MVSIKKNFLLPLVLILIGIFLLLATLEVLPLKKWWPGMIIILGCVSCIYYLLHNNNEQSSNDGSNIPSDTEIKKVEQKIEKIESKVFEAAKSELLIYIKRQGVLLSVVISVIGFFGISAYIDKLFINVKEESEIYKRGLKVYNTRLEEGLNELEMGLMKFTTFKEKVDTIEIKLAKLYSSINQLINNIAAIKDTSELVQRKLQKDMEWNERKIINLGNFVQKTSEELKKVSEEKNELEIAINQFKKTEREIETKKKQVKENIRYTINICYSASNENKALNYEKILDSLGFNIVKELLSDVDVSIFTHFNGKITYNGNEIIKDKAIQLIEREELKDFKLIKDASQQISNNSFTIWILY